MDLTASYQSVDESQPSHADQAKPFATGSEKQQTEMTFGDLTVSSSDATFYGTNSLINKDL